MIKSINDSRIDFGVAAGRMAADMWLPLEDCKRYAALIDGDFAEKLIKYAEATGEKIRVNHGYRPLSYQDSKCPNNDYTWDPAGLPADGGTILQQCGCWKGGNRTRLAPPGKSPHMCGIAIDVASGTKLYKATAAGLKPHGLCKPVKGEPWHVEPILADRPTGYERYRLAVKLGMPFVWGRTEKGDTGVTVCQVQQALVRAGFTVKADGIFGDKTKAAMAALQAGNGLSVTGIADAAALEALGLNKIEGENEMLIKIGSRGPVVAAFQRALISAGFKGEMDTAKISDTNPWGDKSAAAAKLFQAAYNLPQTGEIDDAALTIMLGRVSTLKLELDGYKADLALKKADAKAELNALANVIEKI